MEVGSKGAREEGRKGGREERRKGGKEEGVILLTSLFLVLYSLF